jgi:hypothetical protein
MFYSPGVNVVITIFGGKIGVFLFFKNSWYDAIFARTRSAYIKSKMPIFRQILRREYLINHNIGPWPVRAPPVRIKFVKCAVSFAFSNKRLFYA